MKLVLRGPVWYPDSYSNNMRYLAKALDTLGVDVKLVNTKLENWENVPFQIESEMHSTISRLESKTVSAGEKYILVNLCIPPAFMFDPNAEKNIGYTTFETDRIPPSWIIPCMAMDQIWNPSVWGCKTFAATGLKKQDIIMVPHGIDPRYFNKDIEPFAAPGLEGKTVFGAVFDWTERKNGQHLIASFLQAFRDREDVVLLLKCYFKPAMNKSKEFIKANIDAIRQSLLIFNKPEIIIVDEIIPDDQMGRFYKMLDYHVSLSHGEGFNKPVLEAMACGVPSLVTMWSGHMDFCDAENSFLVADTQMGEVPQQQVDSCGPWYANSFWALPSLAQTMENMQYMFKMSDADYDTMSQKCLQKASYFTWERVAQHAKSVLEL